MRWCCYKILQTTLNDLQVPRTDVSINFTTDCLAIASLYRKGKRCCCSRKNNRLESALLLAGSYPLHVP